MGWAPSLRAGRVRPEGAWPAPAPSLRTEGRGEPVPPEDEAAGSRGQGLTDPTRGQLLRRQPR